MSLKSTKELGRGILFSSALTAALLLYGCGGGSSSPSGDTTAPTILSSTPENNDVNLSVSDNLIITFSEDMEETTIDETSIQLLDANAAPIPTVVTYDAIGHTVTVDPQNDLADNAFYKISIKNTVSDTSANTLKNSVSITFMVGEDIVHNGYSYKVIKSPITGKDWLDRNLGAYEVCTESRDNANYADDAAYVADQEVCFGDYYQWGRNADGHQEAITDTINTPNKTAANTTTTKATSYSNVGHGDFITSSSLPYIWLESGIDDNGTSRTIQWSNTDGTSVCPAGFRVPTSTELYEETINYSGTENETTGAVMVINRDTAFKNFLRFPASGSYNNFSSALYKKGSGGAVWTSSIDNDYPETHSKALFYDDQNRSYSAASNHRGNGLSIRCIKD